MKQEISVDLSGGKRLSFETGKLAKQAHGSVVVRMGDNVVLATATANPDPREANPAGDLYPAVYVRKDNVVTEHLLPSSPLLDFETAEHRKQLGDALRPRHEDVGVGHGVRHSWLGSVVAQVPRCLRRPDNF